MDWLASNFTVTQNPKTGEAGQGGWQYYYLYALERAGIFFGTETFGAHEWYVEGAQYLLGQQKDDGSWMTKGSDHAIWDTCFAILFLRRATRPLRDVASRIGSSSKRADWSGNHESAGSPSFPAVAGCGADPRLGHLPRRVEQGCPRLQQAHRSGHRGDGGEYTIDNGVKVESAARGLDLKTVTLTTSPLVEGVTYSLKLKDGTVRPLSTSKGSSAVLRRKSRGRRGCRSSRSR
jgi:hypothetical protein